MNELENHFQIFMDFLEEAGNELHTVQINGNRNFTWKVSIQNDNIIGVEVNNLGNEPFLPTNVFYETIQLLIESPNHEALFGNVFSHRLGEEELGLRSVEGHVASVVYGQEIGLTILRRITPIKYLLREANICSFGGGYLRLNQDIIFNSNENDLDKKLNTQDLENDYDLKEHKHRFACWAACRAASVINYRFTVQQGKTILNFLKERELPKEGHEFDLFHKKLREDLIANAAKKYNLNWTHGVAAKLINVYYKTIFICDSNTSNNISRFIHPPIDSLLLDSLSNNFKGELQENFNLAKRIRWSNFDSKQYENVINLIRIAVGSKPLWKIEQYWRGYQ